jgi:hypothetical protein
MISAMNFLWACSVTRGRKDYHGCVRHSAGFEVRRRFTIKLEKTEQEGSAGFAWELRQSQRVH